MHSNHEQKKFQSSSHPSIVEEPASSPSFANCWTRLMCGGICHPRDDKFKFYSDPHHTMTFSISWGAPRLLSCSIMLRASNTPCYHWSRSERRLTLWTTARLHCGNTKAVRRGHPVILDGIGEEQLVESKACRLREWVKHSQVGWGNKGTRQNDWPA